MLTYNKVSENLLNKIALIKIVVFNFLTEMLHISLRNKTRGKL